MSKIEGDLSFTCRWEEKVWIWNQNDCDLLATACGDPAADNGTKETIPQAVTTHATNNDSPNETPTNDEVDSNKENRYRNISNIHYSYLNN